MGATGVRGTAVGTTGHNYKRAQGGRKVKGLPRAQMGLEVDSGDLRQDREPAWLEQKGLDEDRFG